MDLKRAAEPSEPLSNGPPSPKRSRTDSILVNPLLEKEIVPDPIRRSHLASNLRRTWPISDTLSLTSPGYLSFTRCGRVPHLTPDISNPLCGNTVLFPLQSVISNPGKATLTKYGKSFKSYINQPDCVLVMTAYDVADSPDNTNYTDQNCVSVWGKGGRKKVTVADYMDLVNVFSPDVAVCLSDNVPANCSVKRADRACARTLHWVNESIRYNRGCKLLAVVSGSGHRHLMLKAASILAEREVYGYVIERVTLPGDWVELVKDVVCVLPEGRPVFMLGCLNSAEVVSAYTAGCHFVDTSHCVVFANAGLAVHVDVERPDIPLEVRGEGDECKENTGTFGPSFTLSPKSKYKKDMGAGGEEKDIGGEEKAKKKKKKESGKVSTFTIADYATSSSTYLDMQDTRYSRVFESVQRGCQCFTCTRHTKAYLNHLLLTKELLGPTLLMIHNIHQLRQVVECVERRVEEGRLECYTKQYQTAFSK